MATVAERLGYPADSRLLILNADDLGFCHAANDGVYRSLRDGLATSASLMVPCPWARGAASLYRGDDVGVHLTVNAELDLVRWGPITHAPSLLDGDGGFPRTVRDMWDHADADELRRECRAQVERAILWGFDVSHLDAHLGALPARPEFFDVYLELAAEAGVVVPDDLLPLYGVGARRDLLDAIPALRPGVTEVRLHPAVDSPELRAMTPDWAARVDDHRLLVSDRDLADAIDAAGVQLIGYRPLRDLMRADRPAASRAAP